MLTKNRVIKFLNFLNYFKFSSQSHFEIEALNDCNQRNNYQIHIGQNNISQAL